MAYKGVLDDIRAAVALKAPARTPVFACSEEFDVRMAGETYEKYCSNPETMAAVQIQSVERFGYDWAWLQVDDCLEFEPLGVGVRGSGNILRATCDYLPATAKTLKSLKMPNPKKDGRMPVLLSAIRQVKKKFGDSLCVCGRTAAPFSSVSLLYGIDVTMTLVYDDEKLLRDTMEFFVELQTRFGLAQIEAGADAIWFGDCNASGHLISEKIYRQFALEPVTRVAKAYADKGGLSFYHASEESVPHLKAQADTAVSAISVGPGLDMAEAKVAVGSRKCLLGNLDPIKLLLNGKPAQIEAEVKRLMKVGRPGGAYIFNSGEMIPRDAPEANMRAMVETAKKLGGA